MVSLAIVLILIAAVMVLLGVFIQGAQILFWIGVVLVVASIVVYLANYLGGRRGGPPL